MSALNEPYNIDFNKEKENRKPNNSKENELCHQNGKEMKPNCDEILDKHTEALEEVLIYLNGR